MVVSLDRKEKYRNARAFIVLLAAFIALLLNIKFKRPLLQSLIIVIVVIFVFFIISSIAVKLIDKIIDMEKYKIVNLSDEVNNDDEVSDDQKNEQNT